MHRGSRKIRYQLRQLSVCPLLTLVRAEEVGCIYCVSSARIVVTFLSQQSHTVSLVGALFGGREGREGEDEEFEK